MLGAGVDKRSHRVTILVAPIRPGKLAVNVDDHSGIGCPGTIGVMRQDALAGGSNDAGFRGREESEAHPCILVLCRQLDWLAGERVEERASDRADLYRQELSAFHASSPVIAK